jgi:hypothetical protein
MSESRFYRCLDASNRNTNPIVLSMLEGHHLDLLRQTELHLGWYPPSMYDRRHLQNHHPLSLCHRLYHVWNHRYLATEVCWTLHTTSLWRGQTPLTSDPLFSMLRNQRSRRLISLRPRKFQHKNRDDTFVIHVIYWSHGEPDSGYDFPGGDLELFS